MLVTCTLTTSVHLGTLSHFPFIPHCNCRCPAAGRMAGVCHGGYCDFWSIIFWYLINMAKCLLIIWRRLLLQVTLIRLVIYELQKNFCVRKWCVHWFRTCSCVWCWNWLQKLLWRVCNYKCTWDSHSHSHSHSFWTTSTVLNLYWIQGAVAFVCFSFFIFIFFLAMSAGLSWILSFRVHVEISYCIVLYHLYVCIGRCEMSQSIHDQRHVCEAYGRRYNKVPGCCNNTWGKDHTYLLRTRGDEEQVNWILSSQRLPGLTKTTLHFCWLFTAGLQDLLCFLYSLKFFHDIFHMNIFIALLISKPHCKKPCRLHYTNKEEYTTSWNHDFQFGSWEQTCQMLGVCCSTEDRKMEFMRIIQAYPRLIVCGLSFESIVSMGKRWLSIWKKISISRVVCW